MESQNHSRRRTGKDVDEELVGYLWPPLWPGSGFAPQPQRVHAGATGQNHCLPGIAPETDRPGGGEMGGRLRKPPAPVEGGARSGNLTLPYYDRRKNLDRGPPCGYFVWVHSVRHLERNGDLA